ncbi:MAG: DUF2894 domain-containing protein [Burkholderiaceae bacterium]|nr:DUF2894 domain-containing protein [Burkholderiaceae bacterium]
MTVAGPLADAAQALATLRAQGGAGVDPVTLARLDATVRRGLQHDAAVQQWLADRLADALACLQAQDPSHTADAHAAPPKAPSPLRALGPATSAELRTAQRLRPTLARLRVQQQIVRAQARQPDNPGPLNSEHLLVRALQQMQTLAPGYLGPFITQVETLLWLDGARGAGATAPADKPQRTPARKAKPR